MSACEIFVETSGKNCGQYQSGTYFRSGVTNIGEASNGDQRVEERRKEITLDNWLEQIMNKVRGKGKI